MKSPRSTTNLRESSSSFVGREADVAAIAERLDEARLVTILGPGGMGKTRLALRFAEHRVETYSAHRGAGVWFCDLSEARNVGDIISSVAAVLGVKLECQGSDVAISDGLGRAIAARGRILIVLDNFDRLAAHAASSVGLWLRVAPSARFLATSRVPLNLVGEQLWSLSPLTREEASELFVRRARQVQPRFDADRERETVAEIVEAIDRIPLAIELAATRMAILSASQLRERLQRPLDVLSGPREVGRHASMRRTVLDSVDLLRAGPKRLFGACAILRNGFTLEAAEAVLGDIVVPRTQMMDDLTTLVQNSLLSVSIEPKDAARYSFFETIRDVAEELGAQEAWGAELQERYATYYATLCSREGGLGDLPALARDLENLQHAHHTAHALAVSDRVESRALDAVMIALGLEPLLSLRGLSRPCAGLFDTALQAMDAVESKEDAVRCQAHLGRGFARRELGESASARADFEQALVLARRVNQSELAAVALTRLGEMSDLAGDTEAGRARFDEALALLRDAPANPVRNLREAEAYLRLGHARRREGELTSARRAIVEAVERYRDLGHDEGLSAAIYELAVIEMFAGAEVEAFAHFDEGLRVAERAGVRVVTGALKTARGCLLQDLGRLEEALEHHAEAANVFREFGSRYREASALYYLATTYLERGEPGEAESILRRARECLKGVGASRYEALMAGCQASALSALGFAERAEEAMLRAERAAALVRHEPALACNVRIHRLQLELRARDWHDADLAIETARSLVAASASDDSRFALRVLIAARKGERSDHDALVVWPDGAAFRAPGSKETVTLPERSPLRRILDHLADRRIAAPGEVVTIDEVIGVGWPSERMGADAALNRAYVALASLRKLGLRGFLLHASGGYLLSPAVVVRRD